MPNGEVLWFDPASGEGRIRRDGRQYPVVEKAIEPPARVPRARVHFDIDRRAGVEWAVNVRLRRGTRVSPQQHRFGDLAGAGRPDAKGHHPLSRDHPGTDWSYEGQPVGLVESWVELMNQGDLATARLLYAPQAKVRWGNDVIEGRDAVIDRLGGLLVDLPFATSTLTGQTGGRVRLDTILAGRRMRIGFDIDHGQIVGQQFEGR